MAPAAGRPFSIVRRISVMVLGVSLVSLLLLLGSLVVFLRPLLDETAMRMATQVRSVESALVAMRPEQRDAFAVALRSGSISLGRKKPPAGPAANAGTGRLPSELLTQLATAPMRPATLFVTDGGSGFVQIHVQMAADDETWWLTLRTMRPSLFWTLVPVLGSISLIGLAAGLTLFVGLRLVTRPMSKLGQDMLAGQSRLRRIDEPPRVSIELQGLIRSFNALVGAVDAAERTRHDLLAGVSHDLRTPLARLRLRAETECPPEVAERMDADFLALTRIIDQFLAYVQGQGGMAGAARHPLSALARAVVDRYAAEGVEIRFRDHGGAERLVPDVAVQRLLANLIDNARAHGRPPIEVEVGADGGDVLLMVFDHGSGIPAALFEHALQPFVRLQPEVSVDGHCGLGLAIVSQVAELLGGRAEQHLFDGRRAGVGVRLRT